MADPLLDRWTAVLAPLAADGAGVRVAGEELLARWAEPHRRYHDLRHLREVLDALGEDPPAAAVLAAYWHDAVYDGRAGDDEERSAQLAERVLTTLGVPPALVEQVAGIVRATADHVVDPADEAAVLLHDADLWVLAAPADRYAAYVEAVRQEYAHVPDGAFAAGRSAVLRGLVDRPRVYAGDHPEWEERARANVAAELARLDAAAERARLSAAACGAAPPP